MGTNREAKISSIILLIRTIIMKNSINEIYLCRQMPYRGTSIIFPDMATYSITIDYEKCLEVAKVIRRFKLTLDTFTNPEFYPPSDEDPLYVANYFFFMVAIDHRTGTISNPFEGIINSKFYRGSDLLYRLGILKYFENPEFFTTSHMMHITVKEVSSWLSVDTPTRKLVRDPEIRAMLLRDAARKLHSNYSDNALMIFKGTEVFTWLRRLSRFLAYSDPVAKKSFLLIKFLERRNLIERAPLSQIKVPVDNHLTRIALRIGIVKPNPQLLNLIISSKEVEDDVDVLIRFSVREAFSLICYEAKIRPLYLDDLLWSLGRTCCTRNRPVCSFSCAKIICPTKSIISSCNGKCPLMEVCEAAERNNARGIYEHTKIDTWYY